MTDYLTCKAGEEVGPLPVFIRGRIGSLTSDVLEPGDVCILRQKLLPVLFSPAIWTEGEDELKVVIRVEAFKLGALDEREYEGGGICSINALAEEPIVLSNAVGPNGSFRVVIVWRGLKTVEIDTQPGTVGIEEVEGLSHLAPRRVIASLLVSKLIDIGYDLEGLLPASDKELRSADYSGEQPVPPLLLDREEFTDLLDHLYGILLPAVDLENLLERSLSMNLIQVLR